MGERQDDVIAEAHLVSLAQKNGIPKDVRKVLNRLCAEYRHGAHLLEAAFPALAKEAFGKPWRTLEASAEKKRRDLWKT